MYGFNARKINQENQLKLKSDLLKILTQNEKSGINGTIVELHLENMETTDGCTDLDNQIQKLLESAKDSTDVQLIFKVTQSFYNFLEPEHSQMPLQVIEILFPGVLFKTTPILENPNEIGKIAKVYFDDDSIVEKYKQAEQLAHVTFEKKDNWPVDVKIDSKCIK